MTNNPVVKTLRRSWWILALFTLLGLGTAQAVVALSPTLYSSTDTLYVSSTTKAGDTGTSAYEGNLLSEDRVKSYKELLGSGMIAGTVADRLHDGTTAAEIQAMTSVANQPETTLLTVTVTDTSPDRAAVIANAYGDVFGDVVHDLEKPNDPAAQAPLQVRTAFPATPYPIPISPRPSVALSVGLLLGLMAGIGVAVLRRRVDDRIDDPATLRTLVGAPHLGSIRRLSGDAPVMTEHPLSAAAEDVRRLRGSLRHVVSAHRPAVVLVASAGPGEGRTTTALELALGLADTGDRVLLLEADLRRPSLSARLGLPDERGLVSLLAAEATPSEVVAHHASGLDVVAAGPVTAGAPERLSSSRLPAVLTELVAPYDWVLVDSPPLTTAADAGILAPLVSGIVVLARHRRTSARTLRRAVDGLVAVGATLLGTALVGSPAGSSRGDRAGLRALLTRDSRPALPAAADEAVAGLPAGARPEEVRAIEAGSDAGVPDPTTSELDLSAWRVETPAAETSTGSDIPEQAGSETAGAVEAETATVDTEPVEPAASEHVEPEPVEPEPVASSTDPEPEPEPLTGLDEELREELGQPVGVGVPADLVALRTSNGSTPPGTNGTRKRGRGKGR